MVVDPTKGVIVEALDTLNVPSMIERPSLAIVNTDWISSTLVLLDPMLTVMLLKFVVPDPEKVWLPFLLNVTLTRCVALPLASKVPLLVKLPPKVQVCVLAPPSIPQVMEPPEAMMTLPATVRDRLEPLVVRIPLTVRLASELLLTLRVTVCPAAMMTSSLAAGTPDGLQVDAVFQLPDPVLVFVTAKTGEAKNKRKTMATTGAIKFLPLSALKAFPGLRMVC